MDYRYGSKADEIDSFFETKRPWSIVKDSIVRNYINSYLKVVQNLKRPILIVDGFSGPGKFGDGTPGSPLIICEAISLNAKGMVDIACLFADSHLAHRMALEENLKEHINNRICEKPYENCADALNHAIEIGKGKTIFVYLDPYGIKDLDFEMIGEIYRRDIYQSTEVLINFNFRTFMRMSGSWNYGDTADEVAKKVKTSKIETVNRAMGGDYWQQIITDRSLDKIAREDAVISAYVDNLKKYFRYAFAIPVKHMDEIDHNVPGDELARYHLIFGTRNALATVLMNDVALTALQPYLDGFKDGLLFDMTPERYRPTPRQEIKDLIVSLVATRPQTRPQIYEAVIPQFFLQYSKKDYRAMIGELTFEEGRLYPDPKTVKRKKQLNDETLLSIAPWSGETA